MEIETTKPVVGQSSAKAPKEVVSVSQDDPPCADYVITLVHGTFAREAKWTEPDSPLANSLRHQLPGHVVIKRHQWSGRNIHQDRLTAGEALAEQLQEQCRQNPEAAHFTIGHSHGGNVLLYALKEAGLDRKMSGAICLNTPFLCTIRRNSEMFFMIFVLLGVFVIPVLGLIGLQAVYQLNLNFWLKFVGAIAVLGLSGFVIYKVTHAFDFDHWLRARREAMIKRIALPEIKNTPVFCLWSAGDEVYNIFGLFDNLANIGYMILSVYGMLLALLLIFCAHLFGELTVFIPYNLPAELTAMAVNFRMLIIYVISSLVYFTGFLVATIVAISVMNLLLKVLPFGIAWYRFIDSFLVRVSFTLVPVTVHRTQFRDVALSASFLNHSMAYQDRKTIAMICEWIVEKKRLHQQQ